MAVLQKECGLSGRSITDSAFVALQKHLSIFGGGVPLHGIQKKIIKKNKLWSRHAPYMQEGSTGTEEGLKLKPSAGNEAEELIIVHERQSRRRESWWLWVRGRMGPPLLEDGSHFGDANYQWKCPPTPKS